jgi:hypothetical protein
MTNFLIDLGLEDDLRFVSRCSMPTLLHQNEQESGSADCSSILRAAIAAKRGKRINEYEIAMRQLVAYFAAKTPARSPDEVRRDFRLIDSNITVPDELRFLDYNAVADAINAPVDLSLNKLNPSPVKTRE